ncbi:MAG: TlpA disulfide reductase family protein [Bryobacteraceae bacterium]
MKLIDLRLLLPRKRGIPSAVIGRIFLAIASLSLLLLIAYDATPTTRGTDNITPQAQRKTAPDFTLTGANGQPVTLSAYKGKVVLLDFWATWCGGCKVEIPWYIEFYKRYRSQGLAVIGVSMDEEGMKVVKPFLRQKGIEYPVVIGNEALAQRYDLTSMPMTLLIDRTGKIAVSHTGVVDKEGFKSHIRELLK